MTMQTVLDLISEGENSRIEFKKKVNDPLKIAKEITALTNTKGGHIFIGVEDNGKICGIDSEKSDIQTIEKATNFYILPNVPVEMSILSYRGNDILVVDVPESNNKPHFLIIDDLENKRTEKKVFVRMGEKSVPASKEMSNLLREQNNSGNTGIRLDIGDNEKRLFRYLETYEKATINDFARLVNISKRRAERSLILLVKGGVLTMHNDSTRDYFTLV